MSVPAITGTVVPNEVADPVGTLEVLGPKERVEIRKIAHSIDVMDINAVSNFGGTAQEQLSSVVDPILAAVMTKDSGVATGVLNDLLKETQKLNPLSLVDKNKGKGGGLLGGLLNRGKDAIQEVRIGYQSVADRVEHIKEQLEREANTLESDIQKLEGLYVQTGKFYQQLYVYIQAGEQILAKMQIDLDELKAKAADTQDPLIAQKVNDSIDQLARMERRVHDLRLTRQIALQTMPQIRMIQRTDQALIEKLRQSARTVLPLWKQQIAMAISQANTERGLATQRAVTDRTNELLVQNSALMNANAIGVAQETERGIVAIETLQQTQSQLINTVEEVLRIQAEGRSRRAAEEQTLKQLEHDMIDRLARLSPGNQAIQQPAIQG